MIYTVYREEGNDAEGFFVFRSRAVCKEYYMKQAVCEQRARRIEEAAV
jgi:hypothetical protein